MQGGSMDDLQQIVEEQLEPKDGDDKSMGFQAACDV